MIGRCIHRLCFQSLLPRGYTDRFAIVIDANMSSDGIKPRQSRFAGTIGVADAMNAKPCLLQEVIGVGTAQRLRCKKTVQLRTHAMDKRRRSREVALLIAGHKHLEIVFLMHPMDRLPAIVTSTDTV